MVPTELHLAVGDYICGRWKGVVSGIHSDATSGEVSVIQVQYPPTIGGPAYIDLRANPTVFKVGRDRLESEIRHTGVGEYLARYMVDAMLSAIERKKPLHKVDGDDSLKPGDVIRIADFHGVILDVFRDTSTGDVSLLRVQTTRNVLRGLGPEFNDIRLVPHLISHSTEDELRAGLEEWRAKYKSLEDEMFAAIC